MSRIQQIHEGLIKRSFSCEELTTQYLAAIQRDNPLLNAYITVTPEEALHAARRVDERLAKGETIGLLEGVPMTLKDNISTAGILTTCASKMLENYRPIYDATAWSLLRESGAVLLGKTNMDEFAMGSTNTTSYFGGTKNPHNIRYVPGGSSGGGACAVSADLAVYALGTDTGGSIRQPAAFCGTVGLKPTYGAVSRYGLIAYASSFDQIGPITFSAEDAAIVAQAICRHDERDATSEQYAGGSIVEPLKNGIQGLRIGVSEQMMAMADGAVVSALEQAIAVYRRLGAVIVPVELPHIEEALSAYYVLSCAEASSNLGRFDGIRYGHRAEQGGDVEDRICRSRSEGFGSEVQRRILLGTYVLSAGYYDAYYQKAQRMRERIAQTFLIAFESCDVLLTPTAGSTAFEVTRLDAPSVLAADTFTVPANMAGLPAISVPCGFDGNALPIGLQMIGGRFTEPTLLRAAYAFERATDAVYLRQGVSV